MGQTFVKRLSDTFHDKRSNDKGIAIELAHAMGRIGLGGLLAMLMGIAVGL